MHASLIHFGKMLVSARPPIFFAVRLRQSCLVITSAYVQPGAYGAGLGARKPCSVLQLVGPQQRLIDLSQQENPTALNLHVIGKRVVPLIDMNLSYLRHRNASIISSCETFGIRDCLLKAFMTLNIVIRLEGDQSSGTNLST